MNIQTSLLIIFGSFLSATPVNSQSQSIDSATIRNETETIRNIIQQTAKAINEGNADGIMAHYSKDIVVSYPGIPDTKYDTFYARYRQMLRPGITTVTVPMVEEILVSGDLAVIRMTWETTITETATQTVNKRKAKDFQVWKKENGTWKFIRGMWYHVRPS